MVRLVWPVMISIREFDTPRLFARNLMHILLAAFSTGGAVSLILSASSWRPTIMFLDDRGWIIILNTTPWGCLLIDIILFFMHLFTAEIVIIFLVFVEWYEISRVIGYFFLILSIILVDEMSSVIGIKTTCPPCCSTISRP